MDAGLLEKLLGGDRAWSAKCVVVLDAEAAVKATSPDCVTATHSGRGTGEWQHATTRVEADACCLLKEHHAILIYRQSPQKDVTGSKVVKQTVIAADLDHVVAIEFHHGGPLKTLGLTTPVIAEEREYRPGMMVG